jgi:hypothetical protein
VVNQIDVCKETYLIINGDNIFIKKLYKKVI